MFEPPSSRNLSQTVASSDMRLGARPEIAAEFRLADDNRHYMPLIGWLPGESVTPV
jgi:hypothetical protein